MEPFETQLKRGKHIRLTETEKASHKVAILRAMQAHPLGIPTLASYFNFSFTSRHVAMRIAAIILIIGAVSSSTLVYASESALPGDTLYPIKIHVKEPLQTSLAGTTEARAQIQKKQIQTRLQEVKTLKHNGTFTKEKAAIVKSALTDNAGDLKATVATLNEEGKQSVAQDLTAELAVNVADLTASTTNDTTTQVTVAKTTAAISVPIETSNTTDPTDAVGAFDLEDVSGAAVDTILSTSVATIDAVTDADKVAVTDTSDSKEQSSTKSTDTSKPEDTTTPADTTDTTTLPTDETDTVAITENTTTTSAVAVSKTVEPKKVYSVFGKINVGPFCTQVKPGTVCEAPQDLFFGKTVAAYNVDRAGVMARSPITSDGNYSLSLPTPGTYRLRVEGFNTSFVIHNEKVTITDDNAIQVMNLTVDTTLER